MDEYHNIKITTVTGNTITFTTDPASVASRHADSELWTFNTPDGIVGVRRSSIEWIHIHPLVLDNPIGMVYLTGVTPHEEGKITNAAITTIKAIRAEFNFGLKEAKNLVDNASVGHVSRLGVLTREQYTAFAATVAGYATVEYVGVPGLPDVAGQP